MIEPDELDEMAAQFGVDRSQVQRDHMISHVLAAISAAADNNLIFFGGTALSPSVLLDGLVDLVQRYSDAPPARLTTLTSAGFVAVKGTAWYDRRASRDLWDLWALATRGHLTTAAADLFAHFGLTNRRPDPAAYAEPPSEERRRPDLTGQVRLTVTAVEACAVVRNSWAALEVD